MTKPKNRTVCVVATEPETATRINAMLDEQRTRLDARWRHAHHASADLLLIDAESVYGHIDWLKAQASGRLVVALSSTLESYDPDYWLRTPVAPKDLVALLNRLDKQIDPAESAVVTPIRPPTERITGTDVSPLTSPAPGSAGLAAVQTTAVEPEPAPARALRLLDLLEESPPLAGRLRLQADGLPDLLLDPRGQAWHSPATLKGLVGWCTRELAATDMTLIGDADFANAVADLPAHAYLRLKWLAHLVRGNGHLDPELDAGGRYKLARWPQSEREFPKHFRIATMMLKSAAAIDEIADLSGAAVADVTNFINAYHAIGFIESETLDVSQNDNRRGGLFARARKAVAAS